MASRYSIGLDFGTESVRVLVVDIRDGSIAGQAARNYEHGVIDDVLPDLSGCARYGRRGFRCQHGCRAQPSR